MKKVTFNKTLITTDNIIQNSNVLSGYNYLVLFSMICMSIMLFNAILTNRYISIGSNLFVLGGTFTSPLFFILGDIVAEIFGYKIARQLIWCGFACQTLFAILCELVIRAPYPPLFNNYSAFFTVFNPLLHIDISSFIAFMIGGLINIRIITRWKILLRGRYFWLRSLGASTISEAIYSIIAIVMMELGSISFTNIYKVILISYMIKVSYSIILSVPANVLVYFIKKSTKIDSYDRTNFNPFKEFSNNLHQPNTI